MKKIWTASITLIADYRDRPFVNKILDYMVSLFSESALDQLVDKTLIPIDFDNYLYVFDDNEIEEVAEEYEKSTIVVKNVFETLLLKDVFTKDKVPSTTEIISTDKNSSDTIKSSSQLPSFGPALSRRSPVSLTSAHATNLCYLSDKDFRSYVTTIQDAFLSRASPQLALQLANKFRLIFYNLAIFSYAHRLCLNLLTPSDIRTRFDQLPQINYTNVSSPLLRLRIELLIYAHTCFINSCHTEGICLVLDHARCIAILLTDLNGYILLIRLLIGLQQHSEMIYIFDILFQSDHSELLLSKISNMHDEHTFTSILMNLNMHHELAIMYRDAGEKLLKTFQFNQQTSSADLSVTLQSLSQYYLDAADTFYLAVCCRQSEQCLKQTRLISL
ncbi:unnamed protein product [Adineta steineri]|uniref:Spatacsin C-terminal domain-containing protein n=1 Tax=Adineta steineri TaxID=433720 RepID=A0A814DHF5_9BILA|nr:unnamed protein product [Adineta steineri]CAF3635365.1 unnamed protein product [Adineta steineri]